MVTGATGLEPATSGVTGCAGRADVAPRSTFGRMIERHYGALLDGARSAIADRLDALEAELEAGASNAGHERS